MKKNCKICGEEMIEGRDCHNNLNLYCKKFPYCDGLIKYGAEKNYESYFK